MMQSLPAPWPILALPEIRYVAVYILLISYRNQMKTVCKQSMRILESTLIDDIRSIALHSYEHEYKDDKEQGAFEFDSEAHQAERELCELEDEETLNLEPAYRFNSVRETISESCDLNEFIWSDLGRGHFFIFFDGDPFYETDNENCSKANLHSKHGFLSCLCNSLAVQKWEDQGFRLL